MPTIPTKHPIPGRNGAAITTTLRRRPDGLSDVEMEVLALYATGLRRPEIAQQIGRSAHTVGHYLTTAKDKLRAKSLAHAVYIIMKAE